MPPISKGRQSIMKFKPIDPSDIELKWIEFSQHHTESVNRNFFAISFISFYKLDLEHCKKTQDNLNKLFAIIKSPNLDTIIVNKDSNKKKELPSIKFIINGEVTTFSIDKNHKFIWLFFNSYCSDAKDLLRYGKPGDYCGILFHKF